MRILVSGASGTVGSALVPALEDAGHQVVRLVRRPPATNEIRWDPAIPLDPAAIEGFDGVVHLAGESIAGRWTAAKKTRIRNSRIQGTRTLAEALAKTTQRPRVLVSASAVGYYGDRGDEVLTENSPSGSGFLAEVARGWEQATEPTAAAGIRVVVLRFGMILSPTGGGLAQMLSPFRMGLGGRMGSGRQWWSWITIDDVAGAIQYALNSEALRGTFNTVAPQPVRNAEFTRALGQVLSRPTIFAMPTFVVRLIFGEMGDELLLASQRVDSSKLQSSGYLFRHAELKTGLAELLQR